MAFDPFLGTPVIHALQVMVSCSVDHKHEDTCFVLPIKGFATTTDASLINTLLERPLPTTNLRDLRQRPFAKTQAKRIKSIADRIANKQITLSVLLTKTAAKQKMIWIELLFTGWLNLRLYQ